MNGGRSFVAWALAVLALAYLTAMVVSGALPRQRQFVETDAPGVLQPDANEIDRVELRQADRSAVFVRASNGKWLDAENHALPESRSQHLTTAVQIMNKSAPVRVLQAEEYRGTAMREFGLDGSPLSVALYRGTQPALMLRFGGRNAEDTLDYMLIDGRDELFLMSRFVKQEWEAVMQGPPTQ